MAHSIDLYGHDAYLKRRLAQLERQGASRPNAKTICAFITERAAAGLSPARLRKYIYMLSELARRSGRSLDRWDRTEVVRVVGTIEQSDYAAATKRDFRVALKCFFKWLKGTEGGYPEEVRWIRTSSRLHSGKLPEDLLTEDDVRRLVAAAATPRDKALIFVLYESGCRAGEIATLRFRQVAFDDYGAKLTVTGKTGARRVRLIDSVPALVRWANAHPLQDDPSAPLWIKLEGPGKHQAMSYASLRACLLRVTRRAGIKKRVHAHLFRHSRATHLATHLTEAQMKEHFGWVQGSDMAATYVHLSGRDVDGALLKLHGLKPDDGQSRRETLKPRKCPRCRSANSAEMRFCGRCRMPLDLQVALAGEADTAACDDLLSAVVRDPDVRALLQQKLEVLATARARPPAAAAVGDVGPA